MKKSILESFFNGELNPADRKVEHSEECIEVMKLLEEVETDLKSKFQTLDDVDQFERFISAQEQLMDCLEEEIFCYAFSLGLTMAKEADAVLTNSFRN